MEQVVLSEVTAEQLSPEALVAPRASAVPSPSLNSDPRLAALENRVKDGDWAGVAKDLGPLSSVGSLPPNLGLLAALAHHELSDEGSQEAVAVGVRCVAGILGLPPDGAMAGVIARRLFRKNPVRFRERKAPPASTSTIIICVALVFGGGAGWLASGGWATIRQPVTQFVERIPRALHLRR